MAYRKETTGVFLLLFLSCFSFIAHSSPLGDVSPSVQSDIERQQKERLQQLEQNKNAVEALQPLPQLPEPVTEPDSDQSACFQVDKVRFQGNTVFSAQELLNIIAFKPSCIGLNSINNYLRIITNHYVGAGYVTSRAFLIPQDMSSGELVILIIEGKVEALRFNGQPASFLQHALPGLTGKVLNLRDIEQGLDQINRLSRYNAQIKLPPGSKQGYSVVDIQSQENSAGTASLGFANNGQESTGETQLSANLGWGNALNMLDMWQLSASKSSELRTSKDAQNLSLSIDIPAGYWNVGYRTSYSDYKRTINNNSFKFESTGRTNSHDFDIKRLFYRDSESKASLKLNVNHRKEKNYILGNLLQTGSRRLSSASLSFDYSTRLAGGFLTLSPRYALGTDWFGGEEDSNKTSVMPKAQFSKATLTASYSYPLSKTLRLGSTLFGQWSDDTLYGSQRLSIGGLHSVRGFKDVSISGDQGYYWRNDLNWSLGQLPYFGSVSAQLALDSGSIVKDSRDALERGSLLGTSLSLNTRNSYVSTSLTLGAPLQSPQRLNADDTVVYYQINITTN